MAEWVALLRARGWYYDRIAEELEISRSYASELAGDPDGSRARARKESYRGTCERCGAATCGGDGREKAPKLCAFCAAIKQHEDRKWQKPQIIEAFLEHVRITGRVPTASDAMGIMPSHGPKFSATRQAEIRASHALGILPHPYTVTREFGSWDGGLQAAGLPANRSGGAGHREPRRPFERKRTGEMVECALCHTEVYRSPSKLKRSARYFCSAAHAAMWRGGLRTLRTEAA